MGKAFAPYCETILTIMVDNIAYQYSKEVRKNALRTIQHILYAVDEPTNITLFKNLFPMIVQLLQKNIERSDIKEIKRILKSFFLYCKTLNENNTEHKNYMDATSFTTLGPLLRQTLELVKETKNTTVQSLNSKKSGIELDEEDVENIKEELAKICNAATYVMEISG